MLNITGARRAQKKSLDIDMAPLIDMIFILLIFFLVTTSFQKETGVEINRPVAASATLKKKASILIGVTKDGRIFMDKREMDPRSIEANVERALAENPDSSIIIVADEKSETGLVIKVMDACKLAGAKKYSPGSPDTPRVKNENKIPPPWVIAALMAALLNIASLYLMCLMVSKRPENKNYPTYIPSIDMIKIRAKTKTLNTNKPKEQKN